MLLKNDGLLPLKKSVKKVAVIGPWANATTLLQGNYFGVAPFIVSPFQGATDAGFEATTVQGLTTVRDTSTAGFPAAIAAAQAADVVVFAGGLDEVVEREGTDRTTIVWPGGQLDLLAALQDVGKPLIVLQFGGGQADSTALKQSTKVGLLAWTVSHMILTFLTRSIQSSGLAILDRVEGRHCSTSSLAKPHQVDDSRLLSTLLPTSTKLR